jgi:cation transport regulator
MIKSTYLLIGDKIMPYNTIKDLPSSVKDSLPKHAQEIYVAAFNNAWEEYKEPSSRATKESLEEISHKVAWTAVKKKYKKDGDVWHEIKGTQ